MQQHHHQVEGRRHPRRAPAGWPGLSAATRRATEHQQAVVATAPKDPRSPVDEAVDIQVRVLDRMLGLLALLVESQEHGHFDPDALGLATLMTADLDRHLTQLMDEQYEPADDDRVLAIERALANMRTRLSDCAER